MAETKPRPEPVRFGVFELDSEAGELRKHGIRLKLQKQPFQVLTVLVERAGEVVTKEELRRRLWPSDTFVDFDHGLHSAVTRLRETLGDSSECPRFIETLPRRGYRFVAVVQVTGNGAHPELTAERPEASSAARRRRFGTAILAGLLSATALLTALVSLDLGGFRRWLLRQSNPAIHSLAVLPLQNLSGDPAQQYFVDGMTDALTAEVSKLSQLRVISRTSAIRYKDTNQALPEIARELNVDGVVEGSVVRAGNRVRVTAELIYASADQHLWAETYERDLTDILKLQVEIAQAIAQQVRIRLTPQERAATGSIARVNPEAYEAYLRGRYFWNQRTEAGQWKSVELFQRAIDLDPNWALPYVGVADSYEVLDAWTVEAVAPPAVAQKTRAAIERSLQLDPSLAEAHTVLAGLKHSEWDWKGAEAEYRRAIELNPNYSHSHQWYGQLLAEMGRFDEALAQAVLAHDLDPLSLILGSDVGYRLYWARRYREAIPPIQKTLELDANFTIAHRFLGQLYEQLGMYEAAISELERASQLSHDNPIDLGALGHVYAVSGQRAQALQSIQQLRRASATRHVSAYEFALVYAGLGERQQAIDWLEKAFNERSAWMLHLKVDPRLDLLRADPRFQMLLHSVGLAD